MLGTLLPPWATPGPLTLHRRAQPPGRGTAQGCHSSAPGGTAGTGPRWPGRGQRSKTQAGMALGCPFPWGRRSQEGRCHSQEVLGPPPVQPERSEKGLLIRAVAAALAPDRVNDVTLQITLQAKSPLACASNCPAKACEVSLPESWRRRRAPPRPPLA